jgi:hypothetical protein
LPGHSLALCRGRRSHAGKPTVETPQTRRAPSTPEIATWIQNWPKVKGYKFLSFNLAIILNGGIREGVHDAIQCSSLLVTGNCCRFHVNKERQWTCGILIFPTSLADSERCPLAECALVVSLLRLARGGLVRAGVAAFGRSRAAGVRGKGRRSRSQAGHQRSQTHKTRGAKAINRRRRPGCGRVRLQLPPPHFIPRAIFRCSLDAGGGPHAGERTLAFGAICMTLTKKAE